MSKKIKIFIIEDDSLYAMALQHYLTSKLVDQLEITVFPVGELALDKVDVMPNFVIVDYNLDTKYFDASNGLKIVQEMKKKLPQTNFILLSGQDSIEVAVEAIKQDKINYIIKNKDAFEKVSRLISFQ